MQQQHDLSAALRLYAEPATAEELYGYVADLLRLNPGPWQSLPRSLVETNRLLEALAKAGVVEQQASGKWWFAERRVKTYLTQRLF